jgi:ABC-type transporter Mla subunit MlaD
VLHSTFNALAQRSANGAASLREIKVLADNTERVLDSGMMQLDMAILNNEPCKAMVRKDNDRMTGTSRKLGMTQPAVNFH